MLLTDKFCCFTHVCKFKLPNILSSDARFKQMMDIMHELASLCAMECQALWGVPEHA